MANTKNYLRDHYVLLLASINAFLSLAGFFFVIDKLINIKHDNGYIIQYRPFVHGDQYRTGSILELISFSVFAILILVINIYLSYRVYKIHRQLAVLILLLGILLLALNLRISSSLLSL